MEISRIISTHNSKSIIIKTFNLLRLNRVINIFLLSIITLSTTFIGLDGFTQNASNFNFVTISTECGFGQNFSGCTRMQATAVVRKSNNQFVGLRDCNKLVRTNLSRRFLNNITGNGSENEFVIPIENCQGVMLRNTSQNRSFPSNPTFLTDRPAGETQDFIIADNFPPITIYIPVNSPSDSTLIYIQNNNTANYTTITRDDMEDDFRCGKINDFRDRFDTFDDCNRSRMFNDRRISNLANLTSAQDINISNSNDGGGSSNDQNDNSSNQNTDQNNNQQTNNSTNQTQNTTNKPKPTIQQTVSNIRERIDNYTVPQGYFSTESGREFQQRYFRNLDSTFESDVNELTQYNLVVVKTQAQKFAQRRRRRQNTMFDQGWTQNRIFEENITGVYTAELYDHAIQSVEN